MRKLIHIKDNAFSLCGVYISATNPSVSTPKHASCHICKQVFMDMRAELTHNNRVVNVKVRHIPLSDKLK